jgi:hypothetical protein
MALSLLISSPSLPISPLTVSPFSSDMRTIPNPQVMLPQLFLLLQLPKPHPLQSRPTLPIFSIPKPHPHLALLESLLLFIPIPRPPPPPSPQPESLLDCSLSRITSPPSLSRTASRRTSPRQSGSTSFKRTFLSFIKRQRLTTRVDEFLDLSLRRELQRRDSLKQTLPTPLPHLLDPISYSEAPLKRANRILPPSFLLRRYSSRDSLPQNLAIPLRRRYLEGGD